MTLKPPAELFVLCGPSCAGKDSLTNVLLDQRPELAKVTTSTTRNPRDGEIPGKSYHFHTRAEFEAARDRGEFLETAEVHGQLYGTSRKAVHDVYEAGKMPVCILDVQGVKTVSAQSPIAVVFISAPLDTIEKRIRAMRPAAEVEARMASVRREVEIGRAFERCLDNEDGHMDKAAAELIRHYDREVRPRLLAYKESLMKREPSRAKRVR